MIPWSHLEHAWIAYKNALESLAQIPDKFDNNNTNTFNWMELLPLARVCVRFVVHSLVRQGFIVLWASEHEKVPKGQRCPAILKMKQCLRQAYNICYHLHPEMVCLYMFILYISQQETIQ